MKNIYKIEKSGEDYYVTANEMADAVNYLLIECYIEDEANLKKTQVFEKYANETHVVDFEECEPDIDAGEEYEEGYSSDDYRYGYLCLGTLREVADQYDTPALISTTDR